MAYFIVTDEGLEYNGIVLKNTQDIQLFIEAHNPASLSASIGIHKPADLTVLMYAYSTQMLEEFRVQVTISAPFALNTLIRGVTPNDLSATINMHTPKDINIALYSIPPHDLQVYINSMVHSTELEATLKLHPPWAINATVDIHSPYELAATIVPYHLYNLAIIMKLFVSTSTDLTVLLKAVMSTYSSFDVSMYVWSLGVFNASLNVHTPYAFNVYTHIWTPTNINTLIEAHSPPPLDIVAYAEPEAGTDLNIIHSVRQWSMLFVEFDTWEYFKPLYVSLYGYYESLLDVVFTMGSYNNLVVSTDGTSGYLDVYVTLKPASRILTTFIPIHTMELKDLYVSINQGWPCGFGSAYSLLEVTAGTAYLYPLTLLMAIIDGSGYKSIGVYINEKYFDSYLSSFGLTFTVSEDVLRPESVIQDSTTIVYDNKFEDMYQEVLHVRFSWPRIRLVAEYFSLSVELFPYHGDKTYSMSVVLNAVRPAPPIMPPSQPLKVGAGFEPNEWPDIFQIKEIELWSFDPPELVRRIEVMFDEQVHEYYWVSKDQKAYRKEVWEQWALLARGYLPSTEYSGQIQYETLKNLSSTKKYSTIDEAVRSLIETVVNSSYTPLSVIMGTAGTYRNFSVVMDVWGYNRLSHLKIQVQPIRISTLSIELTAV